MTDNNTIINANDDKVDEVIEPATMVATESPQTEKKIGQPSADLAGLEAAIRQINNNVVNPPKPENAPVALPTDPAKNLSASPAVDNLASNLFPGTDTTLSPADHNLPKTVTAAPVTPAPEPQQTTLPTPTPTPQSTNSIPSPDKATPIPVVPSIPEIPQTKNGLKTAGVIFGAIAVLAAIGGGFYYYQNINKQKTVEPAVENKPQIFVAQEVVNAERKDLDKFSLLWQDALAKKLSFDEDKQLALGSGGRFNNIPIIKIGDETLYGNDLNYYFLTNHFSEYTSAAKLSEDILNEATNAIMTNSITLQTAAKNNLLTLNDSFFNNAQKDYLVRNQQLELANKSIAGKLVENISGERIAIWFNNTTVPVSVEAGKKLAKAKMDALYTDLKSGKITFKQAGDRIIADKEIGQKIDPAYVNNAYTTFTDIPKGKPVFTVDSLNQELWSLGDGQTSDILIGKDTAEGQTTEQEYLYAIIHVTKRTGGIQQPASQLIKAEFDQAPKQNLGI